MAYGFYITQRGLEKIAEASNTDTKVVINQYLVGDGGDLEGERNPAITALGNELYRKSLTEVDSFEIKGPKILIKTVLPDEVPAMTFNEAGYLDTDDELIVYGTFRPIAKNAPNPEAPEVIEHDNYIEFSADQVDHVTVQTGNEALDSIVGRVDALERDKADKTALQELQTTITENVQTKIDDLEPRVKANEDNKVDKVDGKGLSTNDFTTAYKNQIDTNKSNITSLDSNKVDKVSGKGLSTNDFTTAYKNQIDTNKSNISNKVDKVSGKGLSTYDFTSSYRSQIDTNKSNISSLTSRVSTVESQLSGVAAALEELI